MLLCLVLLVLQKKATMADTNKLASSSNDAGKEEPEAAVKPSPVLVQINHRSAAAARRKKSVGSVDGDDDDDGNETASNSTANLNLMNMESIMELAVGENWLVLNPRQQQQQLQASQAVAANSHATNNNNRPMRIVKSVLDETQDAELSMAFASSSLAIPFPSILASASVRMDGLPHNENCYMVLDVIDDSYHGGCWPKKDGEDSSLPSSNLRPFLAVKDMRPSRNTVNTNQTEEEEEEERLFEMCLARRNNNDKPVKEDKDTTQNGDYDEDPWAGYACLEPLPRRQLRLLRPGDRLCTRIMVALANSNDAEDSSINNISEQNPFSGVGLVLEYQRKVLPTKSEDDEEEEEAENGSKSPATLSPSGDTIPLNTQMTAMDDDNDDDDDDDDDETVGEDDMDIDSHLVASKASPNKLLKISDSPTPSVQAVGGDDDDGGGTLTQPQASMEILPLGQTMESEKSSDEGTATPSTKGDDNNNSVSGNIKEGVGDDKENAAKDAAPLVAMELLVTQPTDEDEKNGGGSDSDTTIGEEEFKEKVKDLETSTHSKINTKDGTKKKVEKVESTPKEKKELASDKTPDADDDKNDEASVASAAAGEKETDVEATRAANNIGLKGNEVSNENSNSKDDADDDADDDDDATTVGSLENADTNLKDDVKKEYVKTRGARLDSEEGVIESPPAEKATENAEVALSSDKSQKAGDIKASKAPEEKKGDSKAENKEDNKDDTSALVGLGGGNTNDDESASETKNQSGLTDENEDNDDDSTQMPLGKADDIDGDDGPSATGQETQKENGNEKDLSGVVVGTSPKRKYKTYASRHRNPKTMPQASDKSEVKSPAAPKSEKLPSSAEKVSMQEDSGENGEGGREGKHSNDDVVEGGISEKDSTPVVKDKEFKEPDAPVDASKEDKAPASPEDEHKSVSVPVSAKKGQQKKKAKPKPATRVKRGTKRSVAEPDELPEEDFDIDLPSKIQQKHSSSPTGSESSDPTAAGRKQRSKKGRGSIKKTEVAATPPTAKSAENDNIDAPVATPLRSTRKRKATGTTSEQTEKRSRARTPAAAEKKENSGVGGDEIRVMATGVALSKAQINVSVISSLIFVTLSYAAWISHDAYRVLFFTDDQTSRWGSIGRCDGSWFGHSHHC